MFISPPSLFSFYLLSSLSNQCITETSLHSWIFKVYQTILFCFWDSFSPYNKRHSKTNSSSWKNLAVPTRLLPTKGNTWLHFYRWQSLCFMLRANNVHTEHMNWLNLLSRWTLYQQTAVMVRGVNVRPKPRTQQEPDTGFCGLGLCLNGFGS